jgi:hypothetical protein
MPLGFLAALGLYMSVIYSQLGVPTALSDWSVRLVCQKQEAADRLPSPKLVLVGGSATLFGLKAALLEKELGVPAINAATHAGLGMPYILECGKQMLRPGDTAVLLPEYEVMITGEGNRREWAGILLVDYLMAGDPAYYRSRPFLEQTEIALMVPFKRLTKGLASRENPEPLPQFEGYYTYDPTLVDAHGDMTGHLAQRRPAVSSARDEGICEELAKGFPRDVAGFPLLEGFCKWAAANRVRVLFAFPNMVRQPAYDGPAGFGAEARLREFCTKLGVPVVGRMHDTLLPSEDFFDTRYHLTDEASTLRTNRFAAQLKAWYAPSRSTDPPGGNR